jgi:hypothetical protein
MGGFPTLLDPLLGRPTMVVEADDRSVRPRERGDDEAHPRNEFPEVMLDLGDHTSRSVPGGRLIVEAPIADQRRVAGPATRPSEQILRTTESAGADPTLRKIQEEVRGSGPGSGGA